MGVTFANSSYKKIAEKVRLTFFTSEMFLNFNTKAFSLEVYI